MSDPKVDCGFTRREPRPGHRWIMQSWKSLHVLTLPHVFKHISDDETLEGEHYTLAPRPVAWVFPGCDLVQRAPEWCCRKSPNSPHISSLLPAIKYSSENRGKTGQRGNVTLFPCKKKEAQSLRKRTTALVSKLRLRGTLFLRECHVTEVRSAALMSGIEVHLLAASLLKKTLFTSKTFMTLPNTLILWTPHKSMLWFMFPLLFPSIDCSYRMILDPLPSSALARGCEVHGGSVGGSIALWAISELFICRCVCAVYNLWDSATACNALP